MAQDSNLISPFLGPDVLARQLRMQQQQQYGQRMLEQGSEIPQGQMVSGHFVAPSWSQYLAQGLKSYLGGKTLGDLPEQQAGIIQAQRDGIKSMFYPQPSPQQLGAALSPDTQEQPQGGAPGQSMMPSIPGMSREQQAMIAMQIGVPEYLKIAANKGGPVNVAAGGSLYNPQTGQVDYAAPKDGIAIQGGQAVSIPGYTDIAARNAGAETAAQEGARAQFDLVDVPDGQGGTVKMPRDQAVQALGGGGQRGQQQTTGFGSSPSPVSQDAAKTLNNNWISGAYQPALDNANSSRSLLGTIQGMRNIPLETGFGTEMKGAAANLLTSLGVKDAAKFATDVQKFQSLAMDRLQTELMKQKGPQTEGDAIRAGQTFARLGNTPEANKFIFDFAQAKANADIRKAEFYQAALPIARRAGDLTEIDRRWEKVRGSIFDDPVLAPYAAYAGTAEGVENGNP